MNIKEIRNTYEGLFWLSYQMIDNKALYLLAILAKQFAEIIGYYGLVSKNYWLVLTSPIIYNLVIYWTNKYETKTINKIKIKWEKMMLEYFANLTYQSQKKTIMDDFTQQIERTGQIICRIIWWMIPEIIDLTINFVCWIVIILMGGNYFILPIPLIYALYWKYRVQTKQENLKSIRTKSKSLAKKIKPISIWNLHLLQNRKCNVNQVMELKEELNETHVKFDVGWFEITKELCLFAEFINQNGLWIISKNFEELILNRNVLNKLANGIGNIGHLSNNLATSVKDFDRLIEWISESSEEKIKIPSKSMIFPIQINSNIYLENIKSNTKFSLETKLLEINSNDVILLKGVSGIGKTQFVNSIQGFIPGTFFHTDSPKEYEAHWEYLNQDARGMIPTNAISVRSILDNESDDNLILNLINITMLDDIFNQANLDKPMENLSGGQKMKLSLLNTLYSMFKEEKKILILDEPEQGIDEEMRVQIINNIIKIGFTILIIYHGSKLDLIDLPFSKVWLFEKVNEKTIVQEIKYSNYVKQIIQEIEEKINKAKSIYNIK